jgi:hypothetical protein
VVQAKEDSGILYEFGYDYPPDAPVIVKITWKFSQKNISGKGERKWVIT